MGLISRLRRITATRIEAFLDSVEQPEIVLPQLLRELADTVNQAANAEAKALTAVKAAQRKRDEAAGRAARMARGAELALADGDGDVDTDGKALAGQIDAERSAETCAKRLATAQGAHLDASAVRSQLQQDLQDLETRKDDILHRAQAVRREQKLRRGAASPAAEGKSLLDEVTRMEAKVEQAEVEIDIQDELTAAPAGFCPTEAAHGSDRDAEVARRLEALKQKHATRREA